MRKPSNHRPKRKRDYRAEYQARVTKGVAAGRSRAAARGHARAADLPKPPPTPIDRNDPREQALKLMRKGASQKQAAREVRISVEQLRRYQLLNTTSQRQAGRWVIFDLRPQSFWIATSGKMKSITLINDEGSEVGRYWSDVNKFLASNDPIYLEPYRGQGVRDVTSRFWPFEVGPNTLRKLDSIGELHFLEIYADVVT